MSRIREVVARMAVDTVFAEQVRSHPDEVAQAYGLSPDEIDKLRGLAAADAQSGPAPLGARLSKSGITGGAPCRIPRRRGRSLWRRPRAAT